MPPVAIPTQIRRGSVTLSPVNLSQHLNSPPLHAGSPPNNAYSLARSPTTDGGRSLPSIQQGKALTPFPIVDVAIKILLLENVNTAAVEMLKKQGYVVEEIKQALGEDEVIEKLKSGGFQAVGIRSKTQITAKVIREVPTVSFIFS